MANNSWRQYGGIYKTDKLHNIGIGTLVADKVLLRQKNITQNQIVGSVGVTEDLDASGYLVAHKGLVSKSSIYINDKILFGNVILTNSAPPYYITGDSTNGYIGINTLTPTYALDITSDKSNILALRSSSSSINNILAQNSLNAGLSTTATSSASSLNFFYGNNVESGQPNNYIRSTGDTLAVISPTTTITSTTLNLNTSLTKINSNISISKRGFTSLFNETMTVYDNSSNPYLYDAYLNGNVNTGSALTMVTSDTSSNTFMYITTTKQKGGAIGGGAFVTDSTRAMLTLGVTDVSFIPAQIIVNGNNALKYRTTTGINTFSPKTENYVMDINGPTRIANGELTTLNNVNFEIKSVKFSKINNQIGFAVGSPVLVTTTVGSSTTYSYIQYIASTTNGGLSWTLLRPTAFTQANTGLETVSNIINTFVYDTNSVYIASKDNTYFYYSTNGGSSFTYVGDSESNTKKKTFSTLYIYNNSSSVKTAFIGGVEYTKSGTSLINPTNKLFYIAETAYSSNLFSSVLTNMTINESDGSGNYLYVVGSGIQKYDVSGCPVNPPVSQYPSAINNTFTYNCVYAFSETYVVCGGNGVLSYTKDGTNWAHTSTSYNIKSIYIYNANNAVAVGDAGTFIYTKDGAVTWSIVPNAILNSSGISGRINGADCGLSGIYMPDLNTFSISNVITTYVSNSRMGKSKLMYGFFPSLFNNANNRILDVSGNMGITGDILADGNIVSTNAITSNSLNTNSVFISGDTTQTGNFTISGNVAISGTLITPAGFVPAYQGLVVTTTTQLLGNIVINGNTAQTGNLTLTGNTIQTGNLTVSGNTTLNGNVSINATTRQVGNLLITGNTTQTGNLTITGNTTQVGNLSITGNTIQTGNLYVTKIVSQTGSLSIMGNTTQVGNLLLSGTTTQMGNMTVSGTTTQTGNLLITGNTTQTGALAVVGTTTQTGNLLITGNTTQTGTLAVVGTTTQTGDLLITGNTSQTGNLTISGNTKIQSGDMSVFGNIITLINIIQSGIVQQFDR
jgi:hypothetical protein